MDSTNYAGGGISYCRLDETGIGKRQDGQIDGVDG
jgi:hypothetical protein